MEETIQQVYLIGSDELEIHSDFLYEYTKYYIYKDRAECICSRFITSNKPLKIKKRQIYIKDGDHKIFKSLEWIGAPKDYIQNNDFKIIEKHARKSSKGKRHNVKD
jgi:hypothetical protein